MNNSHYFNEWYIDIKYGAVLEPCDELHFQNNSDLGSCCCKIHEKQYKT